MPDPGIPGSCTQIGRWQFSRYLAWLAWLFVHLVELIEFENRVLVLVQWGWYYFSRNRAARLITGESTTASSSQVCQGDLGSTAPIQRKVV